MLRCAPGTVSFGKRGIVDSGALGRKPRSPTSRDSWVEEVRFTSKDRAVDAAEFPFRARWRCATKQVKGAVKQARGKAVGDAKLESEGKVDKIEGKVQNAVGGIKDTLKGK